MKEELYKREVGRITQDSDQNIEIIEARQIEKNEYIFCQTGVIIDNIDYSNDKRENYLL